MTKYAVSYFSESKRQDIPIEGMHDGHLCNAYRKRLAALGEEARELDMLLAALWDEIQGRGLDLQYPAGKPPAAAAPAEAK
jgi:hypothetical protein